MLFKKLPWWILLESIEYKAFYLDIFHNDARFLLKTFFSICTNKLFRKLPSGVLKALLFIPKNQSLITFLIGDPSLLSNTNKHTLIQNKSNEALNSIDSISFNLIKVGGMMVGLILVKTFRNQNEFRFHEKIEVN